MPTHYTEEHRRIDRALDHLRSELLRAMTKHAPMNSAHEGYSVIHEELDELWDHVKADTAQTVEGRAEALQVAAMGVRFALDLCSGALPTAADVRLQQLRR